MVSLRIENTADHDNTDLIGLPAASALSRWLLSPLHRGLVTWGLLAAASTVQHPDLHLHITLTPDTVTMVMLMVMTMVMLVIVIMSAALAMLVVMMMVMVMVVMVMGLLSRLLPPRRHLGPSTLLSHNHSRPRVNPLHSEEKRCQTFL